MCEYVICIEKIATISKCFFIACYKMFFTIERFIKHINKSLFA